MPDVFDVGEKRFRFSAMWDLAGRIAISRGYPFALVNTEYLSKYLTRLPIKRFKDGVKVEHILELFERCQAKYKDPLMKRLAEADRLFFGINERKERNEKLAIQIYEELADDLFEARAMCLVVYNIAITPEVTPLWITFLKKAETFLMEQLVSGKFTPVGLSCYNILRVSFDLPADKVEAAQKLGAKYLPLRLEDDQVEPLISCSRCACHFYERFAVRCGLLKDSFCTHECLMVRYNIIYFHEDITELIPDPSVQVSLARDKGPLDYLNWNDLERLLEYFDAKSLLYTENHAALRDNIRKKSWRGCVALLRDGLLRYNRSYKERPLSLEIPIRTLWCQSAILLFLFKRDHDFDDLQFFIPNCCFLLQSGVLKSLGKARAKEVKDHISTILYQMIMEAEDYLRAEVLMSFSGYIDDSCQFSTRGHFLQKRSKRRFEIRKLIFEQPLTLSSVPSSFIRAAP